MGYAYPIDSKVVTNPNGTIAYDRASSSTQLRGLIKSMITNGVNLTESTNLQVMADEETMNLVVKPGYVIIEGALKHFEEDVKVTIGAADTTNPRIDTIVARLNLNEDVRDIVIDVLQGTPSAEPVAPELTRTTSYYEVGLADILVEVGTSQISQAVVTDTRLFNSRCGMISAIGEIDTETLFNQLTTDFDNWFESIKGKLGDDVAGGLQMQIDGLADDIDTLQEDVETLWGNNSTIMWDISENLYVESRNVSTMPRDITNGYVVKLNDTFYAIGGDTTAGTALPSYKYVDGEWVEDTVLGAVSIHKKFANQLSNCPNGGVVSDNSRIYYTFYKSNASSSCKTNVYLYDGETKSSPTYYFAGNGNSGRYLYGDVGIVANNGNFKVLGFSMHDGTNMYLNAGSNSSTNYKIIDHYMLRTFGDYNCKRIKPLAQGVYHNSCYVYLISIVEALQTYKSSNEYTQYDYKYMLVFLNSSNEVVRTVEVPDGVTQITDMVAIGNYIYLTNTQGQVMRWNYNSMKWERVTIGYGSLVEHNGEIHKFTGTSHTACKPYREARATIPKDTKIYFPWHYKTAIHTGYSEEGFNKLKEIEGGYIATETTNVVLKLYDY